MSEPLAYINGQFVPASRAAVPVYDAGFMQGTTVAEQLRTFRGVLFRAAEHVERLTRSLEIVGVDPGIPSAELESAAQDLATRNHALLGADDDLALCMFVTPGVYAPMAPPGEHAPLVCMHTYPLPFRQWWMKYERGEALATTSIAQVPADCWPAQLKCRSRMHYYLADREANSRFPGARALMLDSAGNVTEATTANVLIYRRGSGLITPPRAKVLPGISLSMLRELAAELGLPFTERDITPDEFAAADEALMCSTSPCLLGVATLGARPIGDGRPGPIQRQLLAAWGNRVGVDIAAQAARFATRAPN